MCPAPLRRTGHLAGIGGGRLPRNRHTAFWVAGSCAKCGAIQLIPSPGVQCSFQPIRQSEHFESGLVPPNEH